MQQNLGREVTKYQMAELAINAYLKALSPWNIVSGF
jgi:hypothetical protein